MWSRGYFVRVGSSPLARGLPVLCGREIVIVMDHPRSRGVYGPYSVYSSQVRGSSPLARGLHPRSHSSQYQTRIIPARAGFTAYDVHEELRAADHPRSRGVYRALTGLFRGVFGSSPLARGLRRTCTAPTPTPGIIPARAGFTRRQGAQGPERPDHPRSRGVYNVT